MTAERTSDGLAYEVSGAGPALLLCHEGIGDRRSWASLWPVAASERTLICYDARGFGESADPVGPYSLHEDAASVLDAAGQATAAVLGASMGGATALDLALAMPERVSSLILVATTPSGWEHSPDLIARWEELEAVYDPQAPEAADEIEMQIWLDGVGRGGRADPDVRRRVSEVNRELLRRQSEFNEPVELQPAAAGRLEDLSVPVMTVTGPFDQPSVLAGSRAIADATGARSIRIDGTAHLPHLEKPAEFNDAALGFLREVDPA